MENHELDPFSLAFGAVFAVLGLVFLVARPDVTVFRWVLPVPILLLGALVVALGAGRGRRGNGDEDSVPSPSDAGAEAP